MNTIGDNSGLPADLFSGGSKTKSTDDELGQEEFLELMTTQLNNQDPLDPMESGDFLSQIAQFGTVSGIQDLQGVITDIRSTLTADRSIRAASLVGRDVLITGSSGQLPAEGGLRGAIDLAQSAGDVTVEVLNGFGARVDTIQLGSLGAGLHDFVWDGIGANGQHLPAGDYRLQAIGDVGGTTEAVPTFVNTRVTGVQVAPQNGDLQLELANGDNTGIDAVRRID